ncbi:TlpA family protein disulfide reductase [Pedobacter hiemivivus]|uniref:TlpA family protein disulfide reductase n=1 Tax=Pedobacter hiemivivus TaxID=2530454 RepID=A0A4R0NA23_9SPHI|nr:TlpA disulfide reductase family protein [Pedobacter hiemivivus]TCC97078.1 TlpA family protein disulfide reductase [Pedobacter hiemivivus]
MLGILKNKAMYALLAGLISCGYASASAQVNKGIAIKGKVSFLNPETFKKYNMVWLYKGIGKDKRAVDSVKVNADGTFSLNVKSTVSGLYQLDILKWQTASFWSDNDVDITARGYDTARTKTKNSGFVVIDSKSPRTQLINTALYQKFLADKEMDLLSAEMLTARNYMKKDTSWFTYLRTNGLIRQKADFENLRLKQLIKANPNNPAAVYLLSLLSTDKEPEFFSAELSKLLDQYPQLEEAKQLKKEFLAQNAIKNALKKGSVIPHIAYNDPSGKAVDINSFKGKYLLVDFWASWCGPCRKAIPEIKELYSKYKDSGLEVLSVSVDTDNAAWRKAMSEENMPWPQVLSPDKNKTMASFMIIGIPTLYLIDREGKIVEKYTGFSAKLKTQLEEAFKQKI